MAARSRTPQPPAALPGETAEELYEHSPCGYLSTLGDGTVVRVNQTFLAWSGYSREELLGVRRFQQLLTTAGRIYHDTHYAPLLQMQGRVGEIAFEMLRRDGSVLPVLVNSVQIPDEHGMPLVNRITVFDATDRRRYERELLRARDRAEQASKGKTELLSMISHDVRTPLSGIMVATQLIEEDPLNAAQQRLLGVIKASSEELLELTHQLLHASRVESGRLALEQRSFDLRALLQAQLGGIRMRAEQRGIALQLDIGDAVPPRVLGDPVKIGQVLSNLLGNAIKFTESGAITLAVEAEEGSGPTVALHFAVRDTGSGIPPEQLAEIFDAFTQGSYDIGLRFGGVGLGLSICRTLLELHDSRIEVDSVPGQGSTFSFVLRLQRG